jgi:TonB family protein
VKEWYWLGVVVNLCCISLICIISHAQAQDEVAARYDAATGHLVLFDDPFQGIVLWADNGGRPFVGRFDHFLVTQWLDSAEAIVDTSSTAPRRENQLTPALPEQDTGAVYLARIADGAADSRLAFIFSLQEATPVIVLTFDQTTVRRILAQLRRLAAITSTRQPESQRPIHINPGIAANQGALRSAQAPKYPEELRRACVTGSVWVTFVVDDDGRVDKERIGIVYSDHPSFSTSTHALLERARFHPFVRAGTRVRAQLYQVIRYSIAENRCRQ